MKNLIVHKTVTNVASVPRNLKSHSVATAAKAGWEWRVRNAAMACSIPWTVDCVCAKTTVHMVCTASQCATTT